MGKKKGRGPQSTEERRKESRRSQNCQSTKGIRDPEREASKVGRRIPQIRNHRGRKKKERETEGGNPQIAKGRKRKKKERSLQGSERKNINILFWRSVPAKEGEERPADPRGGGGLL